TPEQCKARADSDIHGDQTRSSLRFLARRGGFRLCDLSQLLLNPLFVLVAFKLTGGFDEAAMLVARGLDGARFPFHRFPGVKEAVGVVEGSRVSVNPRRGYNECLATR